jgi:molybdate transport system ATP-binding protein
VTLRARVGVRLGSLDLDVELAARDDETVALLGPNGAGKSTLLRCLAGLVPLDEGEIDIDGVVVDSPAHDVFVPPERRAVGVVFQAYLLFSNLTALENVAFGPRARGVPKAVARARAREWLARVGLDDRADARPAALSGGQAQRVALARALVTAPRVLLLDEPLAALDAGTRDEVRRDLRRHLSGFAGARIMVTHDPVDAFALADRVVVLEHGQVVQSGSLADVSARPRSRYVADLVGVNLLQGTGQDDVLELVGGARLVLADAVHGPTFAVIQPHAVALYSSAPDGSPRNVWRAKVADIDHYADRARVRLDGPIPLVSEVTRGAVEALGLRPGDEIWASVKATEITTYAA